TPQGVVTPAHGVAGLDSERVSAFALQPPASQCQKDGSTVLAVWKSIEPSIPKKPGSETGDWKHKKRLAGVRPAQSKLMLEVCPGPVLQAFQVRSRPACAGSATRASRIITKTTFPRARPIA